MVLGKCSFLCYCGGTGIVQVRTIILQDEFVIGESVRSAEAVIYTAREKQDDYLFFVSDTDGVKELRNIMKSNENIIPRGTHLEARLNEIIAENKE